MSLEGRTHGVSILFLDIHPFKRLHLKMAKYNCKLFQTGTFMAHCTGQKNTLSKGKSPSPELEKARVAGCSFQISRILSVVQVEVTLIGMWCFSAAAEAGRTDTSRAVPLYLQQLTSALVPVTVH